jgi:DNA mismatch repair ATPase MutS
LAQEVSILADGLALLARQGFESPLLAALVERSAKAPAAVRGLARVMYWVRERDRDWLYWFSVYMMLGTQLAAAMERWRSRHAADLRAWLNAWAEFEALNALACYAHEHPEDAFPEFSDATEFDATGLGHPLLPAECVRNDVSLGGEKRFLVISGSNMAGKSTLLRSMGTNAVLALAGAPVRASKMKLAPFRVCAAIGTPDSLLEGKSRFMAEVERIRQTLSAVSAGGPVLFVIDEIFSGTNSQDRRVAAEAVLRALIAGDAVGAISTHDLALTEIATIAGLHGENVHMASRSEANPLDFDYQLKPGVNHQSNALAIARLAGVEV